MSRSISFLRLHRRKLIIGAVLAVFLFGNKGFRGLVARTLELRRLTGEMTALKTEEAELNRQIQQFRKSDFTVEKLVRRELGYLKPGEVEYRFTPPDNACGASGKVALPARGAEAIFPPGAAKACSETPH